MAEDLSCFHGLTRSQLMGRIRSRGNKKTEIRLISVFRANNIIGWRRNNTLFGKPDFVFRKQKLALFVDGCFWHGCPKHGHFPATNKAFWRKKILRNIERDREVLRFLRKAGWRVVRVWEHDLARKNEKRLVARLRRTLYP